MFKNTRPTNSNAPPEYSPKSSSPEMSQLCLHSKNLNLPPLKAGLAPIPPAGPSQLKAIAWWIFLPIHNAQELAQPCCPFKQPAHGPRDHQVTDHARFCPFTWLLSSLRSPSCWPQFQCSSSSLTLPKSTSPPYMRLPRPRTLA